MKIWVDYILNLLNILVWILFLVWVIYISVILYDYDDLFNPNEFDGIFAIFMSSITALFILSPAVIIVFSNGRRRYYKKKMRDKFTISMLSSIIIPIILGLSVLISQLLS